MYPLPSTCIQPACYDVVIAGYVNCQVAFASLLKRNCHGSEYQLGEKVDTQNERSDHAETARTVFGLLARSHL